MSPRVLIVDDDVLIREALSEALADDGITVDTAIDGRAALRFLSDQSTDVVLADIRMPQLDGLGFLGIARVEFPDVDVVLMTAFDDMPTVATAMREGAADFLVKPLDLHELRRVLARVFEDRESRKAVAEAGVRQPPSATGILVGRHPKMIEIFKIIGQVAATSTNVLIRGETGTGKELIARAIHEQSANRAEPFVAVNCSALPASLLESELFGHTRGSFTGATGPRRGRFGLAGRGTIFLDEIGDTSPDFQTKLLRVLQEHEFFPVGADQAERTDARVVAATHRHLEALIEQGHFREDLYYRLRVVEIQVPPLRERESDLPLIVGHLVTRASATVGRKEPVLSPEALGAIQRHRWPGNIRELENCLRRAVVLATGDVIRPGHLGIGAEPAGRPESLSSLSVLERDHVARVMASTMGHKARAAQILGVSRPRLNRLLKLYGLE